MRNELEENRKLAASVEDRMKSIMEIMTSDVVDLKMGSLTAAMMAYDVMRDARQLLRLDSVSLINIKSQMADIHVYQDYLEECIEYAWKVIQKTK